MKKLTIILSLIFLVYVSSYVSLRGTYTKNEEVDGCGTDRCRYVAFPENKLFLSYSPLIAADKFATGTKVFIENW